MNQITRFNRKKSWNSQWGYVKNPGIMGFAMVEKNVLLASFVELIAYAQQAAYITDSTHFFLENYNFIPIIKLMYENIVNAKNYLELLSSKLLKTWLNAENSLCWKWRNLSEVVHRLRTHIFWHFFPCSFKHMKFPSRTSVFEATVCC